MAVVEGSLNGEDDEADVFQIEARAGDLFNMEVVSPTIDRLAGNSIDSTISIFDSEGDPVDYYGTDAFNDDEEGGQQAGLPGLPRTQGSILVDLPITEDGTYFIKVSSSSADILRDDTGNYELYVHRFNGIQGDVNCDGLVNFLDIVPLIDAITSGDSSPKSDLNNDGVTNFLDIFPFIVLLT